MITDSFREDDEPIITLESMFGERKNICDVAILTFSHKIISEVLARYAHRIVAYINCANGHKPIYLITVDGRPMLIYLLSIGSTMASGEVVELNWKTGAEKFIMFGSCGSLDSNITTGHYIIPVAAYRDEGLSYHYAPPADYVSMRNAEFVKNFFEKNSLPHVEGRVWTTDAMYRETRRQFIARKSEGCIAVDMELAGVQTVCDFHEFQLYTFLEAGDILDQSRYTSAGLEDANHSLEKLMIAIKIVKALDIQEEMGQV